MHIGDNSDKRKKATLSQGMQSGQKQSVKQYEWMSRSKMQAYKIMIWPFEDLRMNKNYHKYLLRKRSCLFDVHGVNINLFVQIN